MASIEKRLGKDGKPHYRAKIRLKGAQPQSETFERLTDAKKWVQSVESAIREGRHFNTSEAKKRTVKELLDKYEAQVVPQKKSQKTQLGMLSWWRSELGDYRLADVSPALVADCRDKLQNEVLKSKKQRSPSTALKYLVLLSHVFTLAVKEWGWVESNPVSKVTKPKEPRGRVRYLDEDERKALLDACRASSSQHLYSVVLIALSTGMRKGEIMALNWEDIKFSESAIIVHHTKNDERRRAALIKPVKAVLQDLAKVRHLNTNLLFPSRANPKKPIDLTKAWRSALKQSGIQDFRFHDLRHCTASYLAMNGASLIEIAEVLGHKTLDMVRRYAHLSDPHTQAVMVSMGDKYLSDA